MAESETDILNATAAAGSRPSALSDYFAPQTRAIEIQLPRGFEAADASRLVWFVERAGFNTILVNCFSGGYTLHPSRVMRSCGFPKQHPSFRGGDPIAALLEAARRAGLTAYALVEALQVGGAPGDRGPILRQRPEWGVRGRGFLDGWASPPYLCPVNRDVWRFLGDLFFEILEIYGFRALYLRTLQYPLETLEDSRLGGSPDYCRCDFCRRAIYHALGVKIDRVPDDPDHPDRYNLTSWRAKQLAALIRYLRLRILKAAIHTLTIAELYLGEMSPTPDAYGYQNACEWTDERLIPIAAFRPLPGVADHSELWIEKLAAAAQCAVVMPVLSSKPGDGFLETLERLSREPIAGIVVREPHDLTAPPLTLLSDGLWREPTSVTEKDPAVSVRALLAGTIPLLDSGEPLRAFLTDALRVLEPLGNRWTAAQRESLSENLYGLEERVLDGKLDLGNAAPPTVRNFRLARQLLHLVDVEP